MQMSQKIKPNPLARLMLDLGPLLVFFLAFQFYGIYAATGIFMGAILLALVAHYILEGSLSVMPLATAALVFIFGGLTLYLQSDTFIKMKPSVLYLVLGLVLLIGLLCNKLFIKTVFQEAFSLTETGWKKLSVRWAFFFISLAALNEVMWRNFSTEAWVKFKVWGIMPIILIFTFLQMPFMRKHEMNDVQEP